MNCQEARKLIDLRVHGLMLDARGETTPGRLPDPGIQESDNSSEEHVADWSELDAHLDACPHCRAEFEELGRVRRLLATAADDRPNDREVQAMWTAVQTAVAVPSRPLAAIPKGWWARNRSLVVSTVGAAAVLAIAFQLGNQHFGVSILNKGIGSLSEIFTNVDSSLPTGSADLSVPSGPRTQSEFGGAGGSASLERRAGGQTKSKGGVAPGGGIIRADANEGAPADVLSAPTSIGLGLESKLAEHSAQYLPPPASPADSETVGAQHLRLSYNAQANSPASPAESPRAQAGTAFFAAGSVPTAGQSAAAQPEKGQSSIPKNLKIIKTGELTIQVPLYGDAVSRVDRIVADKGGFVADAATREETGGALVGHIVIRVSPERFEETFNALKAIGRVASENVKAADVTAEFVDTEARMKSLQITEERLRELIANKSFVDKIASLLEVEKELNRVRTDIEQLQGQLRVMADRVALSTISLTLREPGRTVPAASLSVEVATLDEGAETLGDLLAKTGGRLVSGKTSKRSDGTLMGTYQLETTLARFAEVVSGIEALGRVEERQVKDQQFNQAGQSWADRVTCTIGLVLFERSRQLPTATVRLEVDKLEDAVKRLGDILPTHDASLASNQATRLSDGSNAADIRVRVPAGQFAKLFESIAALGRVTSKTVSGDAGRIVGGAAVVPCDLALTLAEKPREVPRGTMSVEVPTFETARQALSKAIAERQVQVLGSSSNQRSDGTWQGKFRLGVPAKEMETFVGKLEGLGRVASRQISGLGLGDLSRTDPDAQGVIALTMGEKSTLAPAPDESAASIRARVRDGLTGFYSSIGVIAYGLVVLAPWLTLAALFGWIVTRVRAALRRRKTMATQAP